LNSNLIELSIEKKFIVITLNQPETLNAFSKELIITLIDEIQTLNKHNEQKTLILTGKGRAFSSGGNLSVMKKYVEQNKGEEYIESIVPFVNILITLLLEYSGPTFAILNGSAVGGGFNIAMACDFRIVHEKAKFRLGFTDIGLTPATGNSFFVSKVLGIPRTMTMSLFSEVITAEQLVTWGLANEKFSDQSFEKVRDKWKEKISNLDPWQVQKVRPLLYAGMTHTYQEQLSLELTTIKEAGARPLFKERVLNRWAEINTQKQKRT